MTFLNWAMLAGLAAVAIPILIHLLNRQKATVVDWGAMRFLLESLTSRSRRILIEEIILMVLRCLVMALLVMAMARPFLPSRTTIPWALVLPTILAAVILVGIAAAMWSHVRARWGLLAAAAGLAFIAIGASIIENVMQGRQWSFSGGERDVAILIDGSTSMTVPVDGQTNFKRAVAEARAVIQACRPADAISILLAGPVARPVVANPTADRDDLENALRTLVPAGGSMRVVDSLGAAAASLAEGQNPAKKIVLITDGQAIGWDARNEARWNFLASGLKGVTSPTQIVCRTLSLPKAFRNAAVTDVRFSRKVVGTDRSVRIEVTATNTGSTPLEAMSVELSIDGTSVGRQDAAQMLPGAAETVRFDHRFDKPGPHVVSAQVLSEDEMPTDNTAVRVLPVIDKLPVLIVEGDPSTRPLDGAGSFVEIALTPTEDESESKPEPTAPAKASGTAADKTADKAPADSEKPPADTELGALVEPTVVAATDIASVTDFARYNLIIMANVPKLPQAAASKLVRYVQDGGGVLMVLGDKALPTFYNGWTSEGGQPFVPAALKNRRALAESPAHFGIKTFSHPALELMKEATQSDADRAVITAFWSLDVDQKDRAVRAGGLFDTGEPLLVERQVGRGFVLMTAMSLDRRDSNLPSLKCFVPLVHELAYYLAAPALAQANVRPGAEFVMELPARNAEAARKAADYARLTGEVVTPTGRHLAAALAAAGDGLRLSFSGTYEPGLYRVSVPAAIRQQFQVPAGEKGIPLAVVDDAEEGRMAALTPADLEAVAKQVDFFQANSTNEMVAAVTGTVPGEELWKYLAIALLVALLAEIGLTRWIALQRRMHIIETVAFGPQAVDVQTFRERAKRLLAASSQEPQGASKP